MSLSSVFLTAILPVLSIAVVGYLLGSQRDVTVDSLNTVTIYVLIPALIFHSLATTPIETATMGKVVAGVVGYTFVMIAVTRGVGWLRGESELGLSALVLASVFTNAGNYGIPLAEFAFGPVGRSTAVLFLIAQNVMMYTVGVYVASRGDGAASLDAAVAVFKLPLVYAVIAAAVVRGLGWSLSDVSAMMRTIELTGEAAIPIMLLILGIELANTDYDAAIARTGTATLLKLFVAPAVGIVFALGLGFTNPVVARVFVLGCATPTAITPLMLSIKFIDEPLTGDVSVPEFVSAAIFTTTVASVVVLTALIVLLQSGAVI